MKNASAILLAAVLSICAAVPTASASMMTFTGPELTESVKFHCDGMLADGMTVRAGVYGVIYEGREISAFCVDADQYAGSSYVTELDIDSLPNHDQIAYLYDRFIASAVTSTQAAALGTAIWELLYEDAANGFNVSAGEFSITNNSAVAAAANAMLAYLPTDYTPATHLTVLHSECKQDMLISGLGAVPEPTTVALVLAGVPLLLKASRRRRAA